MTFERSARVYRYDEGRSRDIYDDADFDSMVSERDTLLRTQRWDNEGRFERDDDALDELASSSYTYDDDGTLSSISTGSAEQSAPLYTFTYSDSEDARVESIGLDASDQALTFTRDEDARLTLVTLQGADDTPLYELELEGAGCERPVHTWIKTAARLARFPSETEE